MKDLKTKLSYGSGDIYGGGALLIFSLLYMNYLVLVENIPVVFVTTIILIGKIWDAITDPLVGRISDRTRSRFGRRRLYFLIGILPVMLSFVMLFHSFGIEGETARVIYHGFAYIFFGTALTIVMVPYNAILSDMTSDYDERTSFMLVRMVMSGGAALVCAVVPSLIIKSVGGEINGPAQKNGYLVMAAIFAVIFGACWLSTFLGTKEREDLPEPEKITLFDSFSVFGCKPYRNFLGIFLTYQIAIDLVLAIFIFYVDLVILKYNHYELLIGTLLVSQLVLLGLQGRLARKKGKVFPLFVGFPIWIITAVLFIFVNRSTPIPVLILFAVLIAVGASAGNLVTWTMLTDIFDLDEIVTGKRREGLYSGMTTFLRKVASGVAIFILGVGLNMLGFDQNQYNLLRSSAAEFDHSAYAGMAVVAGVKWMFILIPIILLSICLIFAFNNKVSKRRFDAVLKGIENLKEKGDLSALSAEEIADIETATGVKSNLLYR